MEIIHCHVSDLLPNDRSVFERVVGRTLAEDQELIIQVAQNSPQPESNEPEDVVDALPSWCNVFEGLTPEQMEELESSIVRLPGGRLE